VQGGTAKLELTVGNSGGATTGALAVDAHSLPFLDVGDDCGGKALAGGESCKITLSRALGADAAISLSTGALAVSAAPGGAQSMPVSLQVRQGGKLVVDDVDWGKVPTLGMVEHVVNILNPGPVTSGPVTVTIDSMEPSTTFFISSGKCMGQELKPGQSCMVTIIANPPDESAHVAMLTARANFVAPATATLRATGVRAHYTVSLSVPGGGGQIRHLGADYTGVTLSVPNSQGTGPITAIPDAGATFTGWSGTAPCTGTGVCTFVGGANSDLTLIATFSH
jgi:hypothetical protein